MLPSSRQIQENREETAPAALVQRYSGFFKGKVIPWVTINIFYGVQILLETVIPFAYGAAIEACLVAGRDGIGCCWSHRCSGCLSRGVSIVPKKISKYKRVMMLLLISMHKTQASREALRIKPSPDRVMVMQESGAAAVLVELVVFFAARPVSLIISLETTLNGSGMLGLRYIQQQNDPIIISPISNRMFVGVIHNKNPRRRYGRSLPSC